MPLLTGPSGLPLHSGNPGSVCFWDPCHPSPFSLCASPQFLPKPPSTLSKTTETASSGCSYPSHSSASLSQPSRAIFQNHKSNLIPHFCRNLITLPRSLGGPTIHLYGLFRPVHITRPPAHWPCPLRDFAHAVRSTWTNLLPTLHPENSHVQASPQIGFSFPQTEVFPVPTIKTRPSLLLSCLTLFFCFRALVLACSYHTCIHAFSCLSMCLLRQRKNSCLDFLTSCHKVCAKETCVE